MEAQSPRSRCWPFRLLVRALLWLVDSYLLAIASHGEKISLSSPYYKATDESSHEGPPSLPPLTLSTSQSPHLQIANWDLGAPTCEHVNVCVYGGWGGGYNSVHSSYITEKRAQHKTRKEKPDTFSCDCFLFLNCVTEGGIRILV